MESVASRPEEREVGVEATNDSNTFEALFSQCFQGIYRFVFARLQDREMAEDLTSETFLRAWRSWPPRTVVGNAPKAWLFQIARHLVADYYRAVGRCRTVFLREDIVDKGDYPGEGSNLTVLAVRIAFALLSDRDQEILSLRLAGLSNRELAVLLGLSEKAAEMAFLRALKRLQERMGDNHGVGGE